MVEKFFGVKQNSGRNKVWGKQNVGEIFFSSENKLAGGRWQLVIGRWHGAQLSGGLLDTSCVVGVGGENRGHPMH